MGSAVEYATAAILGNPGQSAAVSGSAFQRLKGLAVQTFGTQNATLTGGNNPLITKYSGMSLATPSGTGSGVWQQVLAAVPAGGLLVTSLWIYQSVNNTHVVQLAVGAAGAETVLATVNIYSSTGASSDSMDVPVFLQLRAGERVSMRNSIAVDQVGCEVIYL